MQNNRNRRQGSGGFRSGGGNRSGGNRFGDRPGGGYRKNNFNNGPKEMHKTVCADCKKECEVPFKPTEGRDVYCRDCHSKRKK